MAYYLRMNGTSDYIKLPSITLNKVVGDMAIRRRTDVTRVVWDFRSGISFAYLSQTTAGTDSFGSGTGKVNGVAVTNNTAFIPNNTRCTVEQTFSATAADDGNIFSNLSSQTTSVIDGDIYDIKLYNGATLVAWYDMTLGNQFAGTVQDQSGNGNHATLNGGTWMQDGPSGTAYTKSLNDAISTSDMISKRLTVTVVDTVPTSDSPRKSDTKTLTDSITSEDTITSQSGKAVNLSDSIAIVDAISKRLTLTRTDTVTTTESDRESITRRLSDSITQSDAIVVTGGKAVLLSDNVTVSDSLRKALSVFKADGLGVTDAISRKTSANIRLYDVVIAEDTFRRELPNAPKIIGMVRLSGDVTLNVYLIGSRNIDVNLRGDI